MKHSGTAAPPKGLKARSGPTVRLGLRANLAQFTLLVAVNALVGGTIGQERTILPLLADREFGLRAYSAGLTFIVAFGVTKALTNLLAGALSDRIGRKPVLVAGWLVGIPIPGLLMWAPSWGWIVVANVLLGVNQGLTWSTTVIMKIDLVGPERRGLAMGLNEAAGYGALALTADLELQHAADDVAHLLLFVLVRRHDGAARERELRDRDARGGQIAPLNAGRHLLFRDLVPLVRRGGV